MIRDEHKTKVRSANDLAALRQRVAQLEAAQARHERADVALRESEERYQRITRAVADYVYTVRVENGRPAETIHGAACEPVTGYTPEELHADPYLWIRMVHEEDCQLVQSQVSQILSGDDPQPIEHRIWRKDGELRWIANAPVPHYDAEGKIRSYDGVIRDITERKHAEEALRESEARYRAVVEDQTELICRFLPDKTLTFVNGAYCRYFKKRPGDLVGHSFMPLIPEGDREKVAQGIDALSRGRPAVTHEHRIVTTGDEIRWQQWSNRAIFDENNCLVEYQAVGRDITDRRRAEEALRESEEQYRGVFEAATDGLIIFDLDGNIVEVNPAFCRMHGMTREELLRADPLTFIHPDHHAGFHEAVLAGRQGRVFRTAAVDFRKDGSAFPVEVYGTQLVYRGGTHILGVLRDMTERVEAEEERQNLEGQVRHAQKLESLGVLAGGIAHDFNNLLTSILGNTDLALMDLSPISPARESIKHIQEAARRAAELCRQMLAYSGKGRFVVEAVNLNKVVSEMGHLLSVSISKKTALAYELGDGLPAVEADATQIRQLIMNLITNASEALGDEGGVISVRTGTVACDRAYLSKAMLNRDCAEGTYVYFEVVDTGCGMDAETRERIFDPFFTTKFAGRGLGLAAVSGIVRGHEGALVVESQPGTGTTFRVLLPALDVQVAPARRATAMPMRWRGTGTILLVDDEDQVLTVVTRLLERLGFSVLTAANGRQAIDVFRQHADVIACVLLDLTMPEMDGEETFRELRRIRQDVCVLLASGYDEDEVARRFAGKGLAGFIAKPYQYVDLLEKLRSLLGA